MIDVKNNILYFGYGDILIGNDYYALTFRGFKPPMEIGTCIVNEVAEDNDMEWLTDKFYLDLKDMQEILEFENLLNHIIINGGENFIQFKFKNLIFDFSNYNEKSVTTILHHIAFIRDNLLKVIAC